MKITVILDKEAKITAQLSVNYAAKAFDEIAQILVNKIQGNLDDEDPLKITLSKGIRPAEIEKAPETDNEVKKTGRKLVIMKCPECGNIGACVVEKDQKTITCKHCQNEIPLEDLVHAQYLCPNCNWFADLYVLGDLKFVKCKNCGSEIDLIYHEKKHCYLSANLIK